jgi:hypothetical protein
VAEAWADAEAEFDAKQATNGHGSDGTGFGTTGSTTAPEPRG